MQAGFKEWLKRKFGTVEALNKAWGLVYWGQLLGSWDELPPRDGILNPGWKLEWERYQRSLVTDFLGWQARLVREYVPPRAVGHPGLPRRDAHRRRLAGDLEVPRRRRRSTRTTTRRTRSTAGGSRFMGDFTRSMKRAPYLVTETNAQTIGWDAKGQFPPYDGQLRLQAWAHVASGAHMVEYWHWHSLHYGQETYWKGLLGHDLEPNRVYEEATRIGAELKRLGPAARGHDAEEPRRDPAQRRLALRPAVHADRRRREGRARTDKADYPSVEDQLHKALYRLNVGADFVFAEEPDFTGYDVLARAAALRGERRAAREDRRLREGRRPRAADAQERLHERVEHRALDARARAAARGRRRLVPGVLEPARSRCPLKGDPFGVGAENQASVWADMLLPETAKPLAFYDHPFFGKYPALTRNAFGKGTVTYQGTVLSDALQEKVVADVLKQAGIVPEPGLPAKVRARQAVARDGKALRFYLNFSGEPQSFAYAHGAGTELLSQKPVAAGERLTLGPWDLAVVRE